MSSSLAGGVIALEVPAARELRGIGRKANFLRSY
jgi:hypothetical protein